MQHSSDLRALVYILSKLNEVLTIYSKPVRLLLSLAKERFGLDKPEVLLMCAYLVFKLSDKELEEFLLDNSEITASIINCKNKDIDTRLLTIAILCKEAIIASKIKIEIEEGSVSEELLEFE